MKEIIVSCILSLLYLMSSLVLLYSIVRITSKAYFFSKLEFYRDLAQLGKSKTPAPSCEIRHNAN